MSRLQELELSLVFLPAELYEGIGDHLAQSIRTTHQDLTQGSEPEGKLVTRGHDPALRLSGACLSKSPLTLPRNGSIDLH